MKENEGFDRTVQVRQVRSRNRCSSPRGRPRTRGRLRTSTHDARSRSGSDGRRSTSAGVRALAISVLAAVSPLTPGAASLEAQVSPEILQVLQQGGAWVTLPIEAGVGSFQSGPVPTLGIQLRGHLRIWEEHTGSWHVVMRDLARDADLAILERLIVPGERVDFDYQTGMLGQIRIDVRWSEARDTTLRVWLGTEVTPGETLEVTPWSVGTPTSAMSSPSSVVAGGARRSVVPPMKRRSSSGL